MTHDRIPHLPIVIAASGLAIAGYAVFSYWAVFISNDAALRGDTIGTWKSFAVLAFGFWLGSSSAGKAKSEMTDVRVTNRKDDPVSVKEQ